MYANPVVSPAVPPNGALIRPSYMAIHSDAELDRQLDWTALAQAAHAALYAEEAPAAQLRASLEQALRHAPTCRLLWAKLASLEPSASARADARKSTSSGTPAASSAHGIASPPNT